MAAIDVMGLAAVNDNDCYARVQNFSQFLFFIGVVVASLLSNEQRPLFKFL